MPQPTDTNRVSHLPRVFFLGGPHPIHESLVKYPPEGYEFATNLKASDFEVNKEYAFANTLTKDLGTRALNLIKRPRLVYVPRRCDLIHTSSGVLPVNRKPFVVGVEYYSSFAGLQHDIALEGRLLDHTVSHLSSSSCRKILPFSEASRHSILNAFSSRIKNLDEKTEVLYPAIRQKKLPKKECDDRVRILHLGSGFFEKGGRQLFEAVREIREQGNKSVELVSITSAPEHYRPEFQAFIHRYENADGFQIIRRSMPRRTLFDEFYAKADIFALPSFGDYFGYVFLEAMACGLPLIGTDVFAIPEIIIDGKNGFVVKAPTSPFRPNLLRKRDSEVREYLRSVVHDEHRAMTKSLVNRISELAEDEELRRRMGTESLGMIEDGRFSVERRNHQLRRVYDEALSS